MSRFHYGCKWSSEAFSMSAALMSRRNRFHLIRLSDLQPNRVPAPTARGKTLDSLLYADAAPGALAGLLQIDPQIPCDAPLGNVPLVVNIGDRQSANGLTVAVRARTASGARFCRLDNPLGLHAIKHI